MRTLILTLSACGLLLLAASADEPKKDKDVAAREIDKGTLLVTEYPQADDDGP